MAKAGQIIRFILRGIYKTYRVTAISLGTLLMLGWAFLIILYFTEPVILPNGFQLAPTDFDPAATQILDRDGAQVVPPNVADVMWCNDVVYGWRKELLLDHPAKYSGDMVDDNIIVLYSYFIYDRKTKTLDIDDDHIWYTSHGETRYRTLFTGTIHFTGELKKRNLPAFDFNKAVDYLSALHGANKITEGEMCSISCTNACG